MRSRGTFGWLTASSNGGAATPQALAGHLSATAPGMIQPLSSGCSKELAASRLRYGYRRLHVLFQRKGWAMIQKRTYRLYLEEGLSIRPKTPRRKRACRYRQGRPEVGGLNEVRAMDAHGSIVLRRTLFRVLTVVDCHTREALSTVP